jgi:hypothetical protein
LGDGTSTDFDDDYLFIAELYRNSPDNSFSGSNNEESLWVPSSEPIDLDNLN